MKIQGNERDDEKQRRIEQQPDAASMELAPLGDQHAPAGQRFLNAQSEDGQEAFEEDDLRNEQRHEHHHGANRVGDNVPAMIWPSVSPMATAAPTNSRRLMASVCPRTIRAMSSQLIARWR